MKISGRFTRIVALALVIGTTTLLPAVSHADAETGQDVEYEAGFYYTIQEGDTLWDISQRFSDTPWQWPDLWHENEQIPNPHWIYPGERIRLFRKKDRDREDIIQKQVPQITPQLEAKPAVEKKAPEVYYYYSQMNQVGFIRKPAVTPSGVIFKVLDNKELISVDDQVYIRSPDSGPVSDLTPGSRWTIYRPMAPTSDKNAKEVIGTQHYLLGSLEITQNESRYAIAKITNSFRHILVGDLIMPYRRRMPEVSVGDSTPGIDGKIIVSEDHTELIGEQEIAFIDKGEADNILPGQIYSIFYQETAAIGPEGEQIPLKPVDIGSLIVLHTEENNSTVLVTDASRKINPDTRIRTP